MNDLFGTFFACGWHCIFVIFRWKKNMLLPCYGTFSVFFFFLLRISNYWKHTRIYASPSPNCFLFLDWCCSGLHQAYSKQLMHFHISFIHYVSQRKSDMVCVFRLLHRFPFEHSDNIWVVIKLVIGRFVYVDLFRSSFLRWWRIGIWGWKSMRIYRNVCWFYTISTWAL